MRIHRRCLPHVLRVLRDACLAVTLGACGHTQAPPEPCKGAEPLSVIIQASARLNPDEGGQALATVVRVYQTKGTAKLQDAGFEDMLDRDKDSLGPDFLGVDELTINPGETQTPALKRNAEATHVVVVALFRRPAGTFWRLSKTLPAADPDFCHKGGGKGATQFRFFLEENRVESR